MNYLKHKILNYTKPLPITFHKINGHVKDYDGNKHLTFIPANEKQNQQNIKCLIKLCILLT